MPTRLVLRLAAAALLSCTALHCASPQEQPRAPTEALAPPGALVGSPSPAMLGLLIKARAK